MNADESVMLVCNGEIYNYRALREEFVKQGYEFKTQSDSELIIALYETHGATGYCSICVECLHLPCGTPGGAGYCWAAIILARNRSITLDAGRLRVLI